MSFSGDVKAEMAEVRVSNPMLASSELYGGFLYASKFDREGIRIVTESEAAAGRMRTLLDMVFGFRFDIEEAQGQKARKTALSVTDPDKLFRILSHYGHDEGALALHLNAAVLEEEECAPAFSRGAFLVGGSVSSPEKDYHLELVTRHHYLGREMVALLLDMGFSPKQSVRKSNFVVYFKDSEAIEDFLTKCGAPMSALALMEQKVEKDLRNQVNRRVNCETANLSKAVNAAQEQIAAIRRLSERGRLPHLPEKLRRAAELRMEHPEATLSELLLESDEPLSRSGLSHRLSKLVSLAEENT